MASISNTLGKPEEAAAQLKEALALDPNNAQAYVEMGRMAEKDAGAAADEQEKQASFTKAALYYSQGMEKDPDHVPSIASLARLEAKLGHKETAKKNFKRCVTLDPEDWAGCKGELKRLEN